MEGSLTKETRLLSEDEVAEKLLISRRHLQRLCREKRIRFVRISQRTRGFTEGQIAEFIRSQTVAPKVIDRQRDARVASPPKSAKGGDRKSLGVTGPVSLTEEMRQLCQS